MTVELDQATHLATTAPASFTLAPAVGNNVFTGKVREADEDQTVLGAVPHEAVFILEIVGFPDEPFIDGGLKGTIEKPRVRVTVRSDPRDYDGGRALADIAHAAFDKTPATGYFESRAPLRPRFDEEDDQESNLFIFEVNLKRCI